MAIGDELFSLLGLVPSRDRAGIARGTMADEAKASITANSGNAEGRALIDQGARPPDFELPADIPTAYAAGKQRAAPYGGSGVISSVMPPPPPSERVVASGPAAAPPPEVVRNSDILLRAHQQQAQAARMQQIIGSIGMIANAFNRNPESQAATRQSLGAMVAGGGAGGGGLPDLKSLLEMRDAETAKERRLQDAVITQGITRERAEALEASGQLAARNAPGELREAEKIRETARDKEKLVQHAMKTQGLSRSDAEALYGAGKLADRFSPENLRKDVEVRDKEALKEKLRPMIPEIAKRSGENEAALNAELDRDPGKVLELQRRHSIATVKSTEASTEGTLTDTARKQAKLVAWADARANRDQFLRDNPEVSPAEYDRGITTPDSFDKMIDTLSSGTGKIDKVDEEKIGELKESRKTASAAAISNAGSNRTLQQLWASHLKSGGNLSEKIQDLSKTWHAATGQTLPKDRQATEVFFKKQMAEAIEDAKKLGTNPSNADLTIVREAQGGFATTPKTIQQLLYMKEKANNLDIERHNKAVDKADASHRRIRARTYEVEYPEPNRFMREEVEKRFPGYIAQVVATGKHTDPEAKAYLEKNPQTGVGPGVFDHLVKEEMAKQAAATKG